MLTITIPEEELFDEVNEEFVTFEPIELQLEHSLVSLSKWESKYEKPFLASDEKTDEEVRFYIYCMVISPGEISPDITDRFTEADFQAVNDYLQKKMTATWFAEKKAGKSREVITSELIYYWMIAFNIPFQCETWHLNRLLTLIKVCNVKNNPDKKMSRSEIVRRNRELNAQRRAQLGTRG